MWQPRWLVSLLPAVLIALCSLGLAPASAQRRVTPDPDSKKIRRAEDVRRTKARRRDNTNQEHNPKLNQKLSSPTASSVLAKTEGIDPQSLGKNLIGLYQIKKVVDSSEDEKGLRHRQLFKGHFYEMVDGDTPLNQGDKIRVAFNIPCDGYLYIIDSEEYNEQERHPRLIFPTKNINKGVNYFKKGQLAVLPRAKDNPFYFDLSFNPGQTAEVLRFLLTAEPLADLDIGVKERLLLPSEFDKLQGATLPTTATDGLVLETQPLITVLHNPLATLELKVHLRVSTSAARIEK